jgi:hypothetical protein
VELRGRQWFIVDSRSGLTYGGPYTDRVSAMEVADKLDQTFHRFR